jgi:hypothetical protein
MMPFPPSSLPFGVNLWIAARLMTVFAKRRPLDEILRRATPAAGTRAYANMTPQQIVASVKAAVANPWRMRGRRCLREGLLAFHYLSLAGYRPVLCFGLVPKSALTPPARAHCWVQLDGETILNPPTEPMLDLFAYDGCSAMPAAPMATLAGAQHD